MVQCKTCGTQQEDALYCKVCGSEIAVPLELPPSDFPKDRPTHKGKTVISMILAVISSLLIAALIIHIIHPAWLKNNPPLHYALYIKDGEMFCCKTTTGNPMQATSDLNAAIYVPQSDYISPYTTISHNGKYLFYVDNGEENYYSLYWRYTNDPQEQPVKITDNISSYLITEDGKTVTYLTKDHELYQYHIDSGKKNKISDNILNQLLIPGKNYGFTVETKGGYQVSADGKSIYFVTQDNTLYFHNQKEKEKITTDLDSVEMISQDFQWIYYKKANTIAEKTHNTIYRKKIGQAPIEIAKDVKYWSVCDTGEMYYVKVPTDHEEKSLYSFIIDDIPQESNALRYSLKTKEISLGSLYYYNNKEILLEKDVYDIHKGNRKTTYISYSTCNPAVLQTPLSALSDLDQVESLMAPYVSNYIAIEDSINKIGSGDIDYVDLTYSGQTGYMIGDDEILQKMTVSNKKITKIQRYDTEVSHYRIFGENIVYFSAYDDKNEEIHFNNQLVGVCVKSGWSINTVNNTILYRSNYNESKRTYTFHYFNGTTSVKIADNVYQEYSVNPTGEILYFQNYNQEKRKGDLYVFNGISSKKIDSDVSEIIRLVDRYNG